MGALALALLISCIWLLPALFTKEMPDKNLTELADEKMKGKAEMDSLLVAKPRVYTFFDPNHADDETWLQLGLSSRNVQTIRRFQMSGGRFYQPEDLHKIYGLRPELVERIIPYAKIKKPGKPDTWKYRPRIVAVRRYPSPDYGYAYTRKRVPEELVDVALADTAAFIALPGIGPTLARRIVQFRSKCGGFHSVEQIAEVYGIRDSVFQLIRGRLTISKTALKMLMINEITIDSLAVHPYISYSEARAIVQYRAQHGPFKSPEDLLQVAVISKDWLRKVRPYLQIH